MSAGLVWVASGTAAAAEPGADVRGFRLPVSPSAGLGVEPVEVPRALDWAATVALQHAYALGGGLEHQVSADVGIVVGLFERFAVGVELPAVVFQSAFQSALSNESPSLAPPPRQAFGDVGLVWKTRLLAPAEPRLGGVSLGALTRLTLPTGDPASFVGEGSASFETRVLAEYAGRFASAHGTLGLLLRGDLAEPCPPSEPASCVGSRGHELPWGASVMVKPAWLGLDRAESARLFVAAKGSVPLWPASVDRAISPASLGVSARVRLGDTWLLAGVEVGLTPGVPTVRSMLGLTFAPTGRDSDGDGLKDELDACPLRPEDRDGHQDDDGCPDTDDDQDRVPDALDACPREAEDLDGHDDDDGCPEPARGHGNSGDAEARPRYPSVP